MAAAGAAAPGTAAGSAEPVPAVAGGQGGNAEDVQRLRNALRDELEAPEHLTIVESGSTIILTAGDGRTTRLSADGKKIKDESTKVERRTKWDAGKLVSEISGLGQGKIMETYTLDAENKQLHVTLNIEGAAAKDDGQPHVRCRSPVERSRARRGLRLVVSGLVGLLDSSFLSSGLLVAKLSMSAIVSSVAVASSSSSVKERRVALTGIGPRGRSSPFFPFLAAAPR